MSKPRTIASRGMLPAFLWSTLLALPGAAAAQGLPDELPPPPPPIEFPLAPGAPVSGSVDIVAGTGEGQGLSGPPSDVWGPGNPTIWTRYFATPGDYANMTNATYIDAGGLVPRNSYALELYTYFNFGALNCVGNGLPGCPKIWYFYFLNPANQAFYWYEVYSFNAGGLRYTRITDALGRVTWLDPYQTVYYLRFSTLVDCDLPDSNNYKAAVQHIDGASPVYFIPFPFRIGGGPNQSCNVPSVPRPLVPEGCINTLTPTLVWLASTGATSYAVTVKDAVTQQVVAGGTVGGTTYAVPPGRLAPGRKYAWSVRGINQNGSSAESLPLFFTPICSPPPPPTALSPSNCIETLTPTLFWTSSNGAASYRVRLVAASNGQELVNELVPSTSYSVPPGRLEENRRYDWTVRAVNSNGESAPSNVLSFTPNCGVPPRPQAISPSGCITTLTPTLKWTASETATEYEFYVTDSEADIQVFRDVTSNTSVTVPSGRLEEDRAYHWRVRARNDQGDSDWSNLLRFTPFCGPPQEAPVLFAPRECVGTLQPIFSWSSVPRAEKYQLYVLDTAQDLIVINELQGGTTYTPPEGRLSPNVQYHWHVKGVSGLDESGPTSETVFFTPMCEEVEDDEDIRPDENDGACAAPEDVGLPVSVVTGNMYLDQTDVVVRGVGSLAFGRSYNSENVEPGRYGIFGPGWSHPYETSIWVRYTLLVLRQPDGAVLFFEDPDHDGRYDPAVPAAHRGWFVRRPNGTWDRRFRAGGSQVFDAHGRLTQIVDPVGNVTDLIRDGSGKLRTIREAGGRSLTLTYTGDLLTGLEAPSRLVAVTYGYDGLRRLQTVTYGDGSGFRFDYEPDGRLRTVLDHTGRVVESHLYHPDGRARTSSLADGQQGHTFAYEPLRTTVTDSLGNVTTYDYALFGQSKQVVRITGPCAACGGGADVQEWTYDQAGRVRSHRRGGQTVATYDYDPVTGDLLYERDGLLRATAYTYYPDGRVRTVTGPDGSRTALQYVAAGLSEVTEAIDATRSRTSSTTYTPRGKPDQATDARGEVTTFTYDLAGDLRAVSRRGVSTLRYTYDDMGRPVTGTNALGQTVSTTYDGRGRVKRITHPDLTFQEYEYDLGGRLRAVVDSLGRRTRRGYDGFGRLEFTVDAAGGVTRYTYDAMSRLVALSDARDHATTYERDRHGRITRIVHPDSAVEALSYDAQGRVSTRVDRKGVVTTYRYDPAGRLLKRTYSDGTPPVSYAYDAGGRMISASNAADTLRWTYDLLARPLTESSTANGSVLTYGYAAVSTRSSLALNGEPFLAYFYDELSRLRRLRHRGLEFHFDYDAASKRTRLAFPNDIATTYQYGSDAVGVSRLTKLTIAKADAVLASLSYGYDTAGNPTRKQTLEDWEEYGYDVLDRLVQVSNQDGSRRFAYDAAGNRTVEDTGGNARTASFDANNRLTAQTLGGTIGVAGVVNETAHVTVNGRAARGLAAVGAQDQRFETEIETTRGTNQIDVRATDLAGNVAQKAYRLEVNGSSEGDFLYDANGNLTRRRAADGHLWSYEWDAENRLTRALRDGAEVARFAHDPLGRRLQKVVASVTTRYTYDGADILRETRATPSGTTVFKYVHGPGVDEPLAREDSAGDLAYYHADSLGSIIATTDSSGTITSRRQYDAWGNLVVGADQEGFAFTGREWEPSIGLYFYRARWYDPRTGRFLSEDPAQDGSNFYAYANGAPTFWADPSGLAVGHHYFPQSVYGRIEGLSDAALSVFKKGTTGPIPGGHNMANGHFAYNEAVGELWASWSKANRIDPAKMTAAQAHEFLETIARSKDSRIHGFLRDIHARQGTKLSCRLRVLGKVTKVLLFASLAATLYTDGAEAAQEEALMGLIWPIPQLSDWMGAAETYRQAQEASDRAGVPFRMH